MLFYSVIISFKKIILFLFLFFFVLFFMKIIFILLCSGMFRVPGFIDALIVNLLQR